MASKILSEAEVDEILALPYHTHRQFFLNLKQAMGPVSRELAPGERRVRHGSLSTIDQSRILTEIGTDGRRFRGEGFSVGDMKVTLLDISGASILPQDTVAVGDQLLTLELKSPSVDWREHGYFANLRSGFGIVTYDPSSQECIIAHGEPKILDDDRGYFKFYSLAATVNFGHFIHDLLFQAAFYHLACEKAGSKLIPILAHESELPGSVGGFRYRIMNTIFEAIIGRVEDIVFLNGRTAVAKKCYTTTALFSTARFSATEYGAEWLRKAVSELAFNSELPAGISSRVWVSRADGKTDQRKGGSLKREGYQTGLDNAHLLDDLAESCGYSSVIVGQLTQEQIVGVFRNATSVAGLHGSGLLNILFSPSATNLIEVKIAPWTWESVNLVAEALGHRTHRVGVVSSQNQGDYSVDIGELFRVLRA